MAPTITNRNREVLTRFLQPLRDVLTPEVAHAIVELRADAETQARIDELAERHHESQLSAEELSEYEALVQGANVMAVLQANARLVLNRAKSA